jgi:hypothetical protein
MYQTNDSNNITTEQDIHSINNSTHIPVSRTGELIIGITVSEEKKIEIDFVLFFFLLKAYSIIILLSIIGNVIVVTAICRVQRLRHPTNFILMSLAIADLLVTTTVMIPGFICEIKQKWIFGRVFCNVWVANDITFCTASILHLGK